MNLDKKTVGLQLAAMMKLFGKQIQTAFSEAEEDASIERFILLNVLNSHDNLTQQDLSTMLNKDKSGILRHTDALEKKKLVVRIPDDDDRRKKILMLTKKGVETLYRLKEVESQVFDKFLDGISDEQLTSFSKILHIMQVNGSK